MKEENPNLKAMLEPEAPELIEIAPGVNLETMQALYFNADALREPSYRLYRIQNEGERYYYAYNAAGEIEYYPSVTTLLHRTMPTSPFLMNWILENGKEEADFKRDMAALYGTFMHSQFERLVINRSYNFDEAPAATLEFMEQNNVPDKFYGEWMPKIKKDVLSFAAFLRDWSVKPLAIEIGLRSAEFHYAGCVDMPCIMTDPKSGETFTAIVDFKSGRKGFWEEHELQLHLYKDMWNENFPDLPVVRVFNFSPKDWRKEPTYNLKDQTASTNAAKLPHLLALSRIEDEKKDFTTIFVHGIFELDKGKMADNYISLSLAELIKAKIPAPEVPEEGVKPEEEREKPKEAEKRPKTARKSAKKVESIKDITEGEKGPQIENKAEITEKEKEQPAPAQSNLLFNEVEV